MFCEDFSCSKNPARLKSSFSPTRKDGDDPVGDLLAVLVRWAKDLTGCKQNLSHRTSEIYM